MLKGFFLFCMENFLVAIFYVSPKHTTMAQLETVSLKNNKGGKRLNKKSTKVDLTPMVDLGFLLITFFVFTTTMAKPRVMGLVSPKESSATIDVCESCALTIIPAANNQLYYYEGILQSNTVLKSTSFNESGLRALLFTKQQKVKEARGNSDEMSLIIRPSDASTYKNFVDVMDEVNITGVKRYYLDDITPQEKQLLSRYQ